MYFVSCPYTVCIHCMYDIFYYVCVCLSLYVLLFLFFCKDSGVCIQGGCACPANPHLPTELKNVDVDCHTLTHL